MSRLSTVNRIAILLLAGIPFALAAFEGAAATLRPYVMLHGDTIRLGDIFDGAGENSDAALFQAPSPGRKIVLDANWLYRVARAYRLDWRPGKGVTQSVIERSSNLIDPDRLTDALRAALRSRLDKSVEFEVTLDNPALEIHLPVELPATVAVRRLRYDQRSRRFSATVFAPDDHPRARRIQLAGRVHPLVAVPVLTRRLRSGEIIERDDIATRAMRLSTVGHNTLTDPEKIIGMSSRRTLSMGKPIGGGDVREPLMVARGGLVTMIYRTPNMVITAQGKARQNGVRGDTVRILNTSSGKTIEAVIVGPNEVAVGPNPMQARR